MFRTGLSYSERFFILKITITNNTDLSTYARCIPLKTISHVNIGVSHFFKSYRVKIGKIRHIKNITKLRTIAKISSILDFFSYSSVIWSISYNLFLCSYMCCSSLINDDILSADILRASSVSTTSFYTSTSIPSLKLNRTAAVLRASPPTIRAFVGFLLSIFRKSCLILLSRTLVWSRVTVENITLKLLVSGDFFFMSTVKFLSI